MSRHDKHDVEPFRLKRFVYDCSYLSPFVSNVYMREIGLGLVSMGWA